LFWVFVSLKREREIVVDMQKTIEKERLSALRDVELAGDS